MSHDIPEWLEDSRENLKEDDVPTPRDAPASSSQESETAAPKEVVSGKHSVYTHFPRDPKCEIRKRIKITRGPCRKRIGTAITRAKSFGDLITADHKVLSERCEFRNTSPIRSRGTRFGNSMLRSISVQHENITGNGKELAEVPGAIRENKSDLHRQFLGKMAKLMRNYPGITTRLNRTVPRQVALLREQYA